MRGSQEGSCCLLFSRGKGGKEEGSLKRRTPSPFFAQPEKESSRTRRDPGPRSGGSLGGATDGRRRLLFARLQAPPVEVPPGDRPPRISQTQAPLSALVQGPAPPHTRGKVGPKVPLPERKNRERGGGAMTTPSLSLPACPCPSRLASPSPAGGGRARTCSASPAWSRPCSEGGGLDPEAPRSGGLGVCLPLACQLGGGPSGFRKGLWEKCTILVPFSLHRIAALPRLGCHKPWLKFCAAGLAMLPEWGDG